MNALHKYYVLYADSLQERNIFSKKKIKKLKKIFNKQISDMDHGEAIDHLKKFGCYFCFQNKCILCIFNEYCLHLKTINKRVEVEIEEKIMKKVLEEYNETSIKQ